MQHVNNEKAKIVYKIIGEIFLEERLKLNKSVRILADEYDLQKSMISRLERGLNEPRLCSILSMCEALGIKPSVLFDMVEKRLPEGFSLIDT